MGLILLRKQPQKLAVVRQFLVAMLASLPFAVAGAGVAWPSSILPKILAGVTPTSLYAMETSWMVSLLYLGEVVGALPSAYLLDKIGPKKTLLFSGVIPILSWSIILTSETPLWVYVSRFLSGLQIGIITIVYPLYISEVSQRNINGSLTSLYNITFNAGIFFVSFVGPFVSSMVLVYLFVFLSFLFPLSFQFAPESPHYRLKRDDITRARNSLLWLRGDINRIELEFELDRIEKVVKTQLQNQGSIREQFSSKTLRKDCVVIFILAALDGLSGVNVILAYATITFPETPFEILTPYDCMIILSSATLLSSFIFTYVSNVFYAKKICVLSYCGSSFAMGLAAIWYFLNWKTKINVSSMNFLPFLGCSLHLVIYSLLPSPHLRMINNLDLPSKMKTNLTILSTITKAVIYFVLNKFYLEISQKEGIYVNFAIYSVGCIVAAAFCGIFWIPEVVDRTSQVEQNSIQEDEISKSSFSVISETF